jgi:hypothetical protein
LRVVTPAQLLYRLGRGFCVLLAGVSCRTSEHLLSWRDIVPLPPLFHYSDEATAGVEKGEKVRLHLIGGRKGSDGDHIRRDVCPRLRGVLAQGGAGDQDGGAEFSALRAVGCSPKRGRSGDQEMLPHSSGGALIPPSARRRSASLSPPQSQASKSAWRSSRAILFTWVLRR